MATNDKLMLEAARLIETLKAENASLESELAKARGGSAPSVGAAIADVIQKDLAGRRASTVRKDAGGSEHPHFLDVATRVRKERERKEADSLIRKAGDELLNAVRKKAGIR